MIIKYKKIIILSLITLTIVCVGGFYLKNQSDAINPLKDIARANNYSYNLEKGLEDVAKVAKPAVEAYLTQDKSESAKTRASRLSLYFSGDSPVFIRGPEYSNPNIDKISTKVKSIKSTESETSYLNLTITTENISYAGNDKNTSTHKYWVDMVKIFDGSYLAYDIGDM